MAKGLSITQVKMYCTMVDEKFAPVQVALKEQYYKQLANEKIQVQKDLGVYEQLFSMHAMKEAIERLEQEVAMTLKGKGFDLSYHYHLIDSIERAIEKEAEKRLDDDYDQTIRKEINDIQNKIRLAMIGDEIVDIFTNLDKTIAEKLASLK